MKESFFMRMKVLREYKSNLYSGLLASTGFSLVLLLFFSTFSNQFSIILNWTYKDYLFAIIISQFTALLFGSLAYGLSLSRELLDGNLNVYLTKPISVFLQQLNNTFLEEVIIISPIYFFLLIIYLIFIYPEFSFVRLFISMIFICFAGILFITTMRMFDSFAFFIKHFDLGHLYMQSFYETFDIYPAIMFKNTLKLISFFFANAYYGARVTEYFMGRTDFDTLLMYLAFILVLIIVCIVVIFMNWKIGLKKYEAFG